jgi:hypothetical protein
MKIANEALKIVTQEDAEQAKKLPSRVNGLNPGEEHDPGRLMELLGDIDGLKREIHDRMRRIEAVKEAKSLLMEDALRTEALNKRLAEIGKVMTAVHSGVLAGSEGYEDPEVLRLLGRENPVASEFRPTPALVPTEGVALAWPKSEEPSEPHVSIAEAPIEPPQPAPAVMDATVPEDQPILEAPIQPAEVQPAEMDAAELSETSTAPSEAWANVEIAAEEGAVAAQYGFTPAQMAEWETRWNQANNAMAEARVLLEEANSRLNQAAAKEETAAADFRASQRDLKIGYESASQRLEEAERLWKESDQIGVDAKERFEKSESVLAEARAREEGAATELQSARQELTTAYQFASVAAQRRLESAEFFERTARWAVFAAATAWIAMVWLGWIALVALHKDTTIVLPILGTVILLLIGMVLVKRRVKEPEER